MIQRFSSSGLFLFLILANAMAAAPVIIHVPGHTDAPAPGWEGANVHGLTMALREARERRRTADEPIGEDIHIVLGNGFHPLVEPLLIRPEDSGHADSRTVITAAPGAQPVLTGAVPVTGWRRLEEPAPGLPAGAVGSVWVAEAPLVGGRPLEFRNLWMGLKRVHRARDHFESGMRRILEWDKVNRVAWIPADDVGAIESPGRMEMIIHQMWAISILRVKSITVEGDRARLTFHEPESRVQFEHPWPPVVISERGNSAYYLVNHPGFLDSPGEWYQDLREGKLYYWPQADEDMNEAIAFAPVLETLVEVEGTVDRPVEHVVFEGIQFSHTDWRRPSGAGHVPLQAGMYLLDAYKLKDPGTPDKASLENQGWIGRPPAAVTVKGAKAIAFRNCRFWGAGAAGLDFVEAVSDFRVEGCLFRDIGGNGIVTGTFSDRGIETHLPFDPSDERILCRDGTIANNLVTNVANVDWGCVGILVGFARGMHIEHNEICDVSYSGISLGWGWTFTINAMQDNHIHANHIHHFARRMYDTGGIYTLSPQPNSTITENFIHSIYRPAFVHDPDHWAYIYLDEGSSYFIVRDNWTEGLKYSTNANGPGNAWENNGPSVSAKILQRAGLQEPYEDLRRYATVRPEDPVEP